jgi:dTDP-4-amino-4,6-dideoxygalactose transaminase
MDPEGRARRSGTGTQIRFLRPELPPLDEVARYFAMAESERWFSNGGPCHELLRERIQRRLGRNISCVPVASGTLGLMIAIRALCGSPGESATEVIVPSFTFAATAGAVVWAGFVPVFADVDP